MNRQRGFTLIIMVATLLVTATVIFSIKILNANKAKVDRLAELNGKLETIKQSLVQFATVNGRLPCPADGTLLTPAADPGLASPVVATAACTNNQAAGVVPWATLGLSRETSIDPWGRKITYRVYQGATGFTRANGVGCDTVLPNGSNYRACTGGAAMFTIVLAVPPNDNQAAFVLISHGETGAGARLPQGGQLLPLPNGANINERNNIANAVAGTFSDIQQSDPTVVSSAVNHFDDILTYMTLDSLASAAGRRKDWP